ncbi:MAG: NAD-binding protein [Thermoplasmata archaeon]|nr:MAG: NAD-binding protein [Thermoplasmata archaeon]
MSGEEKAKGSEEGQVHYHGIPFPETDYLKDEEEPQDGEATRLSWSQIRETAPDLYIVSVIILLFGIIVVASVPVSVLTGTQLPFVPPELLALGSTLMLLIGILIIYFAYRLIRREREAWMMTMLLLIFVFIAGVIQGTFTSITTGALVIALLLYLWFRRGLFTVTTRYSFGPQQTLAFAALALVIFYGVMGALYLSDQDPPGFEPKIESYTDALYFTVDTITTLGNSNYAATTEVSKWFTIGLMVMGITSFLVAVGVLLGPYIERRLMGVVGVLSRMQETPLKDHILVCGHSNETDLLIDFLQERGTPFAVISREKDYVESLKEENVNAVYGDPATEEPLIQAKIETAKTLVAIHADDAENAFIIITAKEIRPDIFTIAMAGLPENIPKLKKVGADSVVAPSVIVTRYIGRTALEGHPDGAPEC